MHNSQDLNLDKDLESSLNLDKNWKACEELVRKKIKFNKIKNILLINPPQFQTSHINLEMLKNKRYFSYPPYGLGLLAKPLVDLGYNVNILDLNLEILELANEVVSKNNFSLEKKDSKSIESSYISKDYDGQSFNFDYENIEGIPMDDFTTPILRKKIQEFQPNLVGITCMFTMTHKRMVGISEVIKSIDKSIAVFAGGVHPTSSAKNILKETSAIDMISLFEGDASVPDFIEYINGKNNDVKSLRQLAIYDKEKDKYIETGDRKFPHGKTLNIKPNYCNLDISKYSKYGEIGSYRFWWKKNTIASTILSNRGCRARCSFCSVRNFNGKGVRGRNIDSVVDELQFLKETYGINHFMWLDDDLLFDRERTIGIFNEIVKRNLNITWDASNGIIASALKDEVLDAAAESGCIGMHFGIESGNDEILKQVHKPSGKKHYLALENKLKKYPQIFTKGFLMAGFPGETLSQMKETIDMAKKINLDWYTIQIVHPLPKTEMHKQMVEQGLISEDEIEDEKLNYGNRSGKEKDRELNEKKIASEFLDPFNQNLNRVPTQVEMENIWFTMDYKINYERLHSSNDKMKNKKYLTFLNYIYSRISTSNPLVEYFMNVVKSKLEVSNNLDNYISKGIKQTLSQSEYWKVRFDNLNLR